MLPDFETYVAERLQWKASYALPNRDLAELPSSQVSAHVDAAINATVVQIKANLYAMVKERIVVHEKWPATWLDAVKDRWFPAWVKARWQVSYRTIDIDQKIYGQVCPHQVADPAKKHLEWMMAKA